jgi:glucose/mannose-6-phosphate isomerase
MSELDSKMIYQELDKSNMALLIEHFSDQVAKAWEISSTTDLSRLPKKPKRVLFLGMGGSGIVGSLACALTEGESKTPLAFQRGYLVPAYVNKDTLVIAVSYSGNTRETLHAYQAAVKAGAPLVVLTGGGKLAELAEKNKQPIITIPAGQPPRASLGYLFLPLLKILDILGICHITDGNISSLVAAIREMWAELGPEQAEKRNGAKSLARQLLGKVPLIYGSQGIMGVCAERWCGQMQENSKILAFYNIFPELCHNQVMGWVDRACLGERIVLVSLTAGGENPWLQMQIEITLTLAEERGATVVEISASGKNRLEKAVKAIYLGDLVSLYLAMLNRVDPTEIDNINRLKDAMALVEKD